MPRFEGEVSRRFACTLAWVLRAGTVLAVALMLAGLGWGLATMAGAGGGGGGGGGRVGYSTFSPSAQRDAASLLIAWKTPMGLAALGVVVLMLTPAARVLASVVMCARGRDWMYVTAGAAVFVALVAGWVA